MVAGRELDMVDSGKSPVATDSSETSVFAIRRRKLIEPTAAWCVGNSLVCGKERNIRTFMLIDLRERGQCS